MSSLASHSTHPTVAPFHLRPVSGSWFVLWPCFPLSPGVVANKLFGQRLMKLQISERPRLQSLISPCVLPLVVRRFIHQNDIVEYGLVQAEENTAPPPFGLPDNRITLSELICMNYATHVLIINDGRGWRWSPSRCHPSDVASRLILLPWGTASSQKSKLAFIMPCGGYHGPLLPELKLTYV